MEFLEVAKKVVIIAFKKAEKETLHTLKTPLSKHISHSISDIYREYISTRTFTRYYDKFINGRDKATGDPDRVVLDLLCKYIGFNDFIDFYNRIEEEEMKQKNKNVMREKKINNVEEIGKR